MLSRILVLLLLLTPTLTSAQVVRFATNVGDFDMLLNPTGNANLNPLVDNLLAYVDSGRYHCSVINRASDGVAGDPSDDFVLQMGGFLSSMISDITSTDVFTPIETFDPVIVDADNDGNVDFSTAGLSNIRGSVSLALSGAGPNSGTSSFFVNVGNNEFLDSQGFVPFGFIQDMTTIDRIMALDQVSLDSSPTFTDVPLTEAGNLVIINSVDVVGSLSSFVGPLGPAPATSVQQELLAALANPVVPAAALAPTVVSPIATTATNAVPEPTSIGLLLGGIVLLAKSRKC